MLVIETIMDTINVNGVMYETQPIHLPKNYLEQFNFIDLGAKHGQMKDYCSRMFGTDNGLHIEMDEDHIKVLEERKIPHIHLDISNLTFDDDCVDFSVCVHILLNIYRVLIM